MNTLDKSTWNCFFQKSQQNEEEIPQAHSNCYNQINNSVNNWYMFVCSFNYYIFCKWVRQHIYSPGEFGDLERKTCLHLELLFQLVIIIFQNDFIIKQLALYVKYDPDKWIRQEFFEIYNFHTVNDLSRLMFVQSMIMCEINLRQNLRTIKDLG